jgi:hypothetical protein
LHGVHERKPEQLFLERHSIISSAVSIVITVRVLPAARHPLHRHLHL